MEKETVDSQIQKILFLQLGSPKSPKVSDVRKYLREFLGDPRVVDINPIVWKIILNLFVLPFRPKQSAKAYGRIWDGKNFPLITLTEKFKTEFEVFLKENQKVSHAFLLSTPRISDVLKNATYHKKEKLLVVPLFPQYSESTQGSCVDMFCAALKDQTIIPSFEFLTSFHNSKAFINNSVRIISEYLKKWSFNEQTDILIFSFHGLPKRRVIDKKDPYYRHCFETYYLIRRELSFINPKAIKMSFQSRFGSEEWLTPYTEETVLNEIKNGKKRVFMYSASFVSDCLETIDELGTELGHKVKEIGGEIKLIPCLNEDKTWALDFYNLLNDQLNGNKEQIEENYHSLNEEAYMEMPETKLTNPGLTTEAKKTFKIIFLTLFLDLVGFSIIFPLFPALAKHYLMKDPDNFFLKLIFDSISSLTAANGVSYFSSIVLFGGALGALYSLLQFVATPFWGFLSDRIGRRPVLLISVAGLTFSYLLWFFSGSFTLLIISRFIGGIMGGNISTATAVVADVTDKENRSKGMAIIGVAFALGFIIGPAMGGIFSLMDFTKILPSLVEYGVNPFSGAAFVAMLLGVFNLLWILAKFKETLPPEKRGKATQTRVINPFKLLRPLPYEGINLTNFGYFFFLMAFSGMEFTLTFLAVDRMSYSSMQNAYMFIFIGVIIAFVQGGVVRRSARKVGEKKMAIMGLMILIPGLLCIGNAYGSPLLYLGLFFLSIGSAMAIPCLTSLVSLYTPGDEQGRSIGIFRSLGALARVVGPIIAAIIYWRYGSSSPYLIGAGFLILPIFMVWKLPAPKYQE